MGGRGQVMLVEDDQDIREVIAEILVEEGYEVSVASDGLDALERLRATRPLPRLILLDLMMPRMDGNSFREALGKEPAWAAIPVVMLTARGANVGERDRAGEHGAGTPAGFLAKPLELAELIATVRRFCG